MYCTSFFPKPPPFPNFYSSIYNNFSLLFHFRVFMYYCEHKRNSKRREGLGMRLALHTTPCCWWGRGRGSKLANQTNRLGVKLSEANCVVGVVQWVEFHTTVMYVCVSTAVHHMTLYYHGGHMIRDHAHSDTPVWLTFRNQWLSWL